jgi:hypothetical protein
MNQIEIHCSRIVRGKIQEYYYQYHDAERYFVNIDEPWPFSDAPKSSPPNRSTASKSPPSSPTSNFSLSISLLRSKNPHPAPQPEIPRYRRGSADPKIPTQLPNLKFLVIDEAQEMLSRGFVEQIWQIFEPVLFENLEREVQMAVFCSEMSQGVLEFMPKREVEAMRKGWMNGTCPVRPVEQMRKN